MNNAELIDAILSLDELSDEIIQRLEDKIDEQENIISRLRNPNYKNVVQMELVK